MSHQEFLDYYKPNQTIQITRFQQQNMEGIEQTDLITLKISKQTQRVELLKSKLTQFPKYFFNSRQNDLIVYDNTSLYTINGEQMKNFNLSKQYLITQLAYNFQRDIVVFLTAEGQLYAQFLVSKVLFTIKKQIKKQILFDWVYGISTIFHFFTADQTGVKLYKADQQKKVFKQIKSISGKYNSFFYEPLTQTLVGFPIGDCKQVHPFSFNQSKYSNWFKLNPVSINFTNDENLVQFAKENKSLGLDWGRNNQELFTKIINTMHFTTLIKLNKKCYLVFFFAEQGLLKLFSIFDEKQKQVVIKLPSDSIPEFCVIDNMLVVHLKIEGITFVYDLNGQNLQTLVSPFTLKHKDQSPIKKVYQYSFVGERAIHPTGIISKWQLQLEVIFNYLKNELQIFDFLVKRKQAKMIFLKWIRRELFKIKELNLSRFWKSLFMKFLSNNYPETQTINLIDLFSNVFYTLSQEQLIPKEKLLNIILECVRQALQLKIKIPVEVQNLLFDLLLQFKRYELIVYLLHNQVIKDSSEIIKKVTEQYYKTHDLILATLAVDMTYRSGTQKEMVKLLMKLDRVRDAKKYIKQNYDKIDVLYLIEVAKYIKNPIIFAEYLKYAKSFILLKYPTINIAYLNEAESKLLQTKKNLNSEESLSEIQQKKQTNLIDDF